MRHLTDLNESQQTSDPTSPTSSNNNKSGQKIKKKFLSPSTHKSAKNSTSIDNNHMTSSLSTSLSNLAVKNYFKKKLSLSLVVETESRRLLEVANAHNTANINNGLNQKVCPLTYICVNCLLFWWFQVYVCVLNHFFNNV